MKRRRFITAAAMCAVALLGETERVEQGAVNEAGNGKPVVRLIARDGALRVSLHFLLKV